MCIKNDLTNTSISIDDIDIIIIENQQTTITSALLTNLAQANISVVFVDDRYNPSAISIGLYKNSRTTKIQRVQISIKKPRLNRLWKSIIYNKILNQADTLNTKKEDEYLYSLLSQINSGDKNNIEAIGASYYFKELFGKDFVRNNTKDNRNIALNYGYSILRSSICRYIIAYGLNPSFGIWHSSELNAFNLADDLIEPFRPIVDHYVLNNINKKIKISSKNKQEIVGLLYLKVLNNQNKQTLVNEAIKNIVSSYQSFCLNKRDNIELFGLIYEKN
jgi:CRISPR-associated protein Cas1